MTNRVRLLQSLLGDTQALRESLSGQSVTARPDCEYAIAYVASWVRHIDASIGIIRYADKKGQSSVVAPLQRLMLEHAVAAAMLANDPQSWEAYLRQSTDGAQRIRNFLTELGREVPENVFAFIDSGLETESQEYKRYRKIRNRFESLNESGQSFYYLWLQATQLSHAGTPTAFLFLRETPGDIWPTHTYKPQIQTPKEQLLVTCIEPLLWSLDSFSSMLADDPLRNRVSNLKQRISELIEDF